MWPAVRPGPIELGHNRLYRLMAPADGRALRILYLITALEPGGGAEQQVCSLARSLRRRGHEVGVVSMLPIRDPALAADLEAHGVRTATLGMRRGIPDPRALLRLRRLIVRWRADVLHGHMVHANLLARLSRLLWRRPVVVCTVHNQNEGAQWRYVAYRLTDRLADLTTAVSQEAADDATRRGGAPAGAIRVVPNGVDVGAFAPDAVVRERVRGSLRADGRFVWLAAGRLVEAKGYPQLIAAFKQVHERHPEATLLVAGAGPLEADIRGRVDNAGLAGVVSLLGLRPDLPALMQGADAFVMSSLWEGLPMVMLEAAASSLPVVATDVGGARAVVLDSTTGYLVPPGEPAALARAMGDVMALSLEGRMRMGRAARDRVSGGFDLDRIADAWEALYVEHARGSAQGGPSIVSR